MSDKALFANKSHQQTGKCHGSHVVEKGHPAIAFLSTVIQMAQI